MRVRTFFLVLLALAVVRPGVVLAQSAEAEVRQAVMDHYSAIRSGDMEGVIGQHSDHFTGFLFDNGLLLDLPSREAQHAAWDPMTAAGFTWTPDVRHLQVQVLGDVAVAMFYVVGPIAMPGEAPKMTTRRVSEVWVREDGRWVELHHHDSPLVAVP